MRVLDLSLVSHCNYVARVQSIYSGQDFDCHPFCICLTPCLFVLRHRQVLCRVNAVGKLMNKLSLPLISLGKSNPLGAVPSVRAPLLRESKHHQLQIPSQTYFLFCAREFSYIFFGFILLDDCPDYTPLFRHYAPGGRQGYAVLSFGCGHCIPMG